MINAIKAAVTEYITGLSPQRGRYFTYDHPSAYSNPCAGLHMPVLCISQHSGKRVGRRTDISASIVFYDDRFLVRNANDAVVSEIHYADPGLLTGLLVLQRHVRQLSMAQVIIFQELKSFAPHSNRTILRQ